MKASSHGEKRLLFGISQWYNSKDSNGQVVFKKKDNKWEDSKHPNAPTTLIHLLQLLGVSPAYTIHGL